MGWKNHPLGGPRGPLRSREPAMGARERYVTCMHISLPNPNTLPVLHICVHIYIPKWPYMAYMYALRVRKIASRRRERRGEITVEARESQHGPASGSRESRHGPASVLREVGQKCPRVRGDTTVECRGLARPLASLPRVPS